MTAMLRPRTLFLMLICGLVFSTSVFGTESSLVRIHRQTGSDRGPLIDAGIEIVAETNDAWLAESLRARLADIPGVTSTVYGRLNATADPTTAFSRRAWPAFSSITYEARRIGL